jgi:hypothetical protein
MSGGATNYTPRVNAFTSPLGRTFSGDRARAVSLGLDFDVSQRLCKICYFTGEIVFYSKMLRPIYECDGFDSVLVWYYGIRIGDFNEHFCVVIREFRESLH